MELSKILLIVLVVVGIIHLMKNKDLVLPDLDLPVEDKTNVKNNVMKKVKTRGLKTDDKLGNPIHLHQVSQNLYLKAPMMIQLFNQ